MQMKQKFQLLQNKKVLSNTLKLVIRLQMLDHDNKLIKTVEGW